MEQDRVERRLAAILAADVVGYSRLVRSDEEGTLAAFRALRQELIDPALDAHDGRIVKTMGDGLLIDFGSVVDAVRAAAEVQQAMARRNDDVPEERRIVFRVGINLGDVVIDGDDIHGDGVNVAARLEALADPGGVCVSGAVYDQIRDRLDLTFEDMGEREVKNIDRPVRVWRWAADGSDAFSQSGDSTAALPIPDKPSIVVLPFDNLSGDPEQEYFADGITEDITTELSRFSSIFVIARNTAFAFRGKAVNVKQVARELGVQYVLEGSVRKAGNRVRITAQLIDAPDDRHVWAERYDRELEDIFAVQDEMVERIVGNLEPELMLAQSSRAYDRSSEDTKAQDNYWRAVWHFYRMTKDDHAETQRLLELAIEKYPERASDAWAVLASRHLLAAIMGFSNNPAGSLRASVEAGERSIALDDRSAYGHAFLGVSLVWARQHDRGMSELERAVDLNPNSAIAHFNYANGAGFSGRPLDAMEHLRIGMRLSPRDPLMSLWLCTRALAHLLVRELDEAVEAAQKAAQLDPSNVRAHLRLACALAHSERLDEGREAFARASEISPGLDTAYIDVAYPFRDSGDRAYFLNGLRKAGLME